MTARWAGLRAAILPLGIGLLVLAALFQQEIVAAVRVWGDSTAYNHCYLILPIALWLAWERRDRLPGVPIRPLPAAALLVLPLGAAWLVAERLGIMEGRQLAALGCLEVLVLVVLGWRMARALAAPLIYLVFLVPFGAFLTGPLQDFTARFVVQGLDLIGITNFSDGHTIEIPEGVFYVAEACAGLRFLIAAVAFGVLYAFTLYRTPGRRILFVLASVVIPIVANGIRALGIVAAGHWLGSAQAAAADHLIYGWLFFSVVIVLLILAGLPFRQDERRAEPAVALASFVGPSRMALPAVLVLLLAAAAPAVAGRLDLAAATRQVEAPTALAGCSPAASTPPAAGLARFGASLRAFDCGGGLHVLAIAFPPGTNPTVLLGAQRTLLHADDEDMEVAALPEAGAPGWVGVSVQHAPPLLASALWIDGAAAGGGLRSRIHQARNTLRPDGSMVMLLVAQARGPVAGLLRRANDAGLSAQMEARSARLP